VLKLAEAEMGDNRANGLQARLMSQALRKITGNIGKSSCTVFYPITAPKKIQDYYSSQETTTMLT